MSERVGNLNIKCFMCQNIAAKIKEKKALTTGEEYHLNTDLSAIEKLRQVNSSVIKQELK